MERNEDVAVGSQGSQDSWGDIWQSQDGLCWYMEQHVMILAIIINVTENIDIVKLYSIGSFLGTRVKHVKDYHDL